MNKTTHYRAIAEQCRALAEATPQLEQRLALLDMAKRWTALADEREKLVREHPDFFPEEVETGARLATGE